MLTPDLCRHIASLGHNVVQDGPRCMMVHVHAVIRPKWVNSSPPGQDGRHFSDDMFRYIFVNEKFHIVIKISLMFVPKGPIDNTPALV